MSWLGTRGIGAAAVGIVTALALGLPASLPATAADEAYTVGSYPVDSSADNAVAAKEKALADGRQAAFRSLLKRLVPVTAYGRLGRVKQAKASELIDGVVVRSERTSATQYIASLDFSFQPQPVRELLQREGVPYIDVQAPPIVLVPVYLQPAPGQGPVPAALSPPRGSKMWRDVWAGLDLEHALTPVKQGQIKADVTAEVVEQLVNGDGGALASLAGAYSTDLVMLAVAQPDLAGQRLNVTLAGRDAVGAFVLKRSYRLALNDVAYTGELAAVVALGVLEGRWKAMRLNSIPGGAGTLSSGPLPVQMLVEFRNLQQWHDMHRQIAGLPGMEDLQIGGLSARSADVAARFPGGAEALAGALASRGLDVRQIGGALQVRPAP
ncbi:MAG: DUF2066 domain-containing protein [Hyphomicrobiaceae bacterium]|nr:DUF2066 domain-containing protein [Hyphomicrobiaceae bacterium]